MKGSRGSDDRSSTRHNLCRRHCSIAEGVKGLAGNPQSIASLLGSPWATWTTVEEVTLLWHVPEETHPMLTRQVDGIGIGNGTLQVRGLTRQLVGTVHVQEVLGKDRIHMTGSSQGVGVVHSSYRQTDRHVYLESSTINSISTTISK